MKKICFVIAFLFSMAAAYSQSFYIVANNTLKKLTFTSSGQISSVDMSVCNTMILSSVALYKNTIYSQLGTNLSYGTISGNSVINCARVGQPVPGGNSLTVDTAGVLYFNQGNTLCTFNTKTQVLTHLGNVPYGFGGDLIFYKGTLFMASTSGIVKIDISNPANSTLVIPSTLNIYGLAAVAYSSTQNKIYASSVNINQTTDIIEIDLDNYRFLNKITTLPYVALDAASDVEDGEIPKIVIDSIQQVVTCPSGVVNLQVFCKNPLVDYQYILNNNITNTTGTFQVRPGTYDIKVKTAAQIKDTTIVVAGLGSFQSVTSVNTTDVDCDNPGQVSFTVNNGSQYNIEETLANVPYPLPHTFTNVTAGTHNYYLFNQQGCIVDTFSVAVNRSKCAILVSSISVSKNCSDLHKGDVQINAIPHNSAPNVFTLNGVTNGTGAFASLDPGTYPLHIANSDGVTLDTTVTVPDFYLQKPTVTYTKTDAVCDVAGTITIYAKSGNTAGYITSGSASFPSGHTFTGQTEGVHPFKITDLNGCLLDTLSVNIGFTKCDPVTFPNTFTPNKDGINDVFMPMQGGVATRFKLSVYNRYGILMYTSTDIGAGWDGTYRGATAPTGTYYWMASYYDQNNLYRTQSGSVTLIR